MIVYPRGVLGSLVLTRIHGSAAYKAIIPSILSTIILIVINYQGDNPNSFVDTRWFEHPYPIASLIVAFTFLLTFKCSFSYNRVSYTTFRTSSYSCGRLINFTFKVLGSSDIDSNHAF
jgi:hypothetical protein